MQNLGKQPLQKLRRWEYNVKMDLGELGYEDGRWIEVAQDHAQWWALVSVALNLQVLLPENWL
jgi:hypothetical protein